MTNTKTPRSRQGEIRYRTWMGTLFDVPRTQILECLADMDCEWVFQKENCPETQRPHFHVGIHFKNPRGINFQENWPNTVHWDGRRDWRSTKTYCTKVASRVDGPWTNIKGLTWRATIRDPMAGKIPYFWQEEIVRMIGEEPDDRTVHWYWDAIGNTGKSSLAKHIRMFYKAIIVGGTSKDCFCAIKSRLETDDVLVVIFDLSRSQKNRVSYTAIEQIKNGAFFSGKYESGDVIMNPPHVIVFANFPPDLDGLSADRWHIVNLGQDNSS